VKSEEKAYRELLDLTAKCIGVDPEFVLLSIVPTFRARAYDERARAEVDGAQCLEDSRRTQLRDHVAPPALLFLTDPAAAGPEPSPVNLSRENVWKIAGVTGLVLLLAVLVTVLVGVRLVRPLRALTEAARQPVDRQGRVPVTTRDEIGYLATALNDLTDRREKLEDQRRAMVSDVAHELRTPLTNIRSWLEAAQDGVTPADPALLDLLLEEAVLLQHLIDDLRDLAAADAGKLRIHPEQIFVADAVAHVVEAHRGAAEAKGVALSTDLRGDPELRLDPVRLRQLVGNLMSNAVRHTPPGGSVRLVAGVVGGDLVIEVADTGAGIAAEDLPHIFDRFWRADRSRSRATGGSGLGLSIARKLAQAHDGDITIASTPGLGTTATVRIPAR
jgi:two-component system sensor histidine kinase BaeS